MKHLFNSILVYRFVIICNIMFLIIRKIYFNNKIGMPSYNFSNIKIDFYFIIFTQIIKLVQYKINLKPKI